MIGPPAGAPIPTDSASPAGPDCTGGAADHVRSVRDFGGERLFSLRMGVSPRAAPLEQLGDLAGRIRRAVNEQGYPEVDHIELFGTLVSSNSQMFL